MALQPRQRSAETVVDAVPESEMTGLGPVDVERLGVRDIVLRPGSRPPGR